MKVGIGNKVFLFNRETNGFEIVTVINKYSKDKVMRYDVRTERGINLEMVSTSPHSIFFIDLDKTQKFFDRINSVAA